MLRLSRSGHCWRGGECHTHTLHCLCDCTSATWDAIRLSIQADALLMAPPGNSCAAIVLASFRCSVDGPHATADVVQYVPCIVQHSVLELSYYASKQLCCRWTHRTQLLADTVQLYVQMRGVCSRKGSTIVCNYVMPCPAWCCLIQEGPVHCCAPGAGQVGCWDCSWRRRWRWHAQLWHARHHQHR
jgi:hypothetical protein